MLKFEVMTVLQLGIDICLFQFQIRLEIRNVIVIIAYQ